MTYQDIVYANNGTATYSAIYRGNSIYDPNYSFGGHEAYGRDQWSNFYQSYKVMGSSIKIKLYQQANAVCKAWVMPDSLTTVSNTEYPWETPLVSYKTLDRKDSTSGNRYTLKNYMSTKRMFNVTSLLDDDFGSGISTNPSNEWYWYIRIQDVDLATNVQVYLDIRITYYVKLYNRANLPSS